MDRCLKFYPSWVLEIYLTVEGWTPIIEIPSNSTPSSSLSTIALEGHKPSRCDSTPQPPPCLHPPSPSTTPHTSMPPETSPKPSPSNEMIDHQAHAYEYPICSQKWYISCLSHHPPLIIQHNNYTGARRCALFMSM